VVGVSFGCGSAALWLKAFVFVFAFALNLCSLCSSALEVFAFAFKSEIKILRVLCG
jgi:hypothetical protein